MRIPYFDYAATAPVDPRIIPAMTSLLGPDGDFANPSSTLHAPGRTAAAHIEAARAQVSALLDADPREIVFTSGATEANNPPSASAERHPGGHIVTSAIEHDAVLAPCAQLEARGWQVHPRDAATFRRRRTRCHRRRAAPGQFGVADARQQRNRRDQRHRHGRRAVPRAIHRRNVDAAQTTGALALVRALPVDPGLRAQILRAQGIGALYLRRRGASWSPSAGGGQGADGAPGTGHAPDRRIGLARELARREREADAARIARCAIAQAGVSPLGGSISTVPVRRPAGAPQPER